MPTKSSPYVTNRVFKKEMRSVRLDVERLSSEISEIREVMATKSDMQRLAVEIVKTKDDLSEVRATMATKSDIQRLAVEIVKTKDDLSEMRAAMATKSDIDRVLSQMTDFSKDTHIVLQNQEIHRSYLRDHETRLSALEKRPGTV